MSGDNKVAMSTSEMPVGFRATWFLFALYPSEVRHHDSRLISAICGVRSLLSGVLAPEQSISIYRLNPPATAQNNRQPGKLPRISHFSFLPPISLNIKIRQPQVFCFIYNLCIGGLQPRFGSAL